MNPFRIAAVFAVSIFSYLVFMALLSPFFVQQTMMHMAGPGFFTLNIVSLMLAIGLGAVVFFLMSPGMVESVRGVLSADEQALLDEVLKAGEITQDSLRFRLGWSKAKVSAVLTNLDRANLVQRERQGKTYNVFVKKQF